MSANLELEIDLQKEWRGDASPLPEFSFSKNGDLFSEYVLAGEPVVGRRAMAEWECMDKWSKNFLALKFPNHMVKVYRHSMKKSVTLPFSQVEELLLSKSASQDIFLCEFRLAAEAQVLLEDIDRPSSFNDWFDVLEDERFPRMRWIFFSPEGVVNKLHVDNWGTSTWNGLISGKKRWFLRTPVSSTSIRTFYCDQMPGDIVFIPSLWPHEVVCEKSSVAVTENFVNESNAAKVSNAFAEAGLADWEGAIEKLRLIMLG